MPEHVLTEMLKQLAVRRRAADESQRIDMLIKFKRGAAKYSTPYTNIEAMQKPGLNLRSI